MRREEEWIRRLSSFRGKVMGWILWEKKPKWHKRTRKAIIVPLTAYNEVIVFKNKVIFLDYEFGRFTAFEDNDISEAVRDMLKEVDNYD